MTEHANHPRPELTQLPATASHFIRYQGDSLTVALHLSHPLPGRAMVRTNIGRAATARHEIITNLQKQGPLPGADWRDIEMQPSDTCRFELTLPLIEVGHFAVKCYFLPTAPAPPIWPSGDNVTIKVEPADTIGANTLYNAFVRQFGPNRAGQAPADANTHAAEQLLDQAGYTVIPPSGTFADVIERLDFIIYRLGCRIIQLLPIHPTPTTYGRMGRFGSPYAALSFTEVDPALAKFDSRATPLEQFIELVDEIHRRQAKIFLDIAVNHTGWAARLHESHPQWLARTDDGEIEMPGAWGVTWADLTRLDYSHRDLWQYMANVFLTWCRRGVDGFRCDAGYMIPAPAWRFIIARVREQYPQTIFLLEGLGGKISVTRQLLAATGFNWAYSELFQNYDRPAIEHYLPLADDISQHDGLTVHFAETHDNNRLAARSSAYARMRTALCALTAQQGGFGFANGVEWLATEKIDVHQSTSLNWGATDNQIDDIHRLNTLLRNHCCFYNDVELKQIQCGDSNVLVMRRLHRSSGKRLIVVANLDDQRPNSAVWPLADMEFDDRVVVDLLTDRRIELTVQGNQVSLDLEAAQVFCLSPVPLAEASPTAAPPRIIQQCLRAKAMELIAHYGPRDDDYQAIDRHAEQLAIDPACFCKTLRPPDQAPNVVHWQYPQDVTRTVMWPPEHALLIMADHRFTIQLRDHGNTVAAETALPTASGRYFALIKPRVTPSDHRYLDLHFRDFTPGDRCRHRSATLLQLGSGQRVQVPGIFTPSASHGMPQILLATNGRGAMLRAPVDWGQLTSRYDALLAGNLDPRQPENRWIMFTRCRAWVIYQGYWRELSKDYLIRFTFNPPADGHWQFYIPLGGGTHVIMDLNVQLVAERNQVIVTFARQPANGVAGQMLSDDAPIGLIVRPDIENRSFHDVTKAWTGPETAFPKAISAMPNGFSFAPDNRHFLRLDTNHGKYNPEPEWLYMVHRPIEATRGLDADSDLFSPGYFDIPLSGGACVQLTARMADHPISSPPQMVSPSKSTDPPVTSHSPQKLLNAALDAYIVKREPHLSVIAGYPWFLDWGRDSLIFARALIAQNRLDQVRQMLLQFGRFESQGTLPNMICGADTGNRNTSDAPLWFMVVCDELMHAENSDRLLAEPCGQRSMADVLHSLGDHLRTGAPNGVYMDPESKLIFSPAHFTWMDTNHPAASPRQGYPIEIQALWWRALKLLARIDRAKATISPWDKLQRQVQHALVDRFFQADLGYFSDCLHASAGTPAGQAVVDDALRPNQLIAITLEAVNAAAPCRAAVQACNALLVPGALRSLADRPVQLPLPVMRDGRLLNDPHQPYQGRYQGDEDTQRKPAYHNGTAWSWLLPQFCEAWVTVFGPSAISTAQAWLGSSVHPLTHGCIGHLPEICDGNHPHTARGCDAQAWGASEWVRVWTKLASQHATVQ